MGNMDCRYISADNLVTNHLDRQEIRVFNGRDSNCADAGQRYNAMMTHDTPPQLSYNFTMTRTTWIVLVCALAAMAQVCSALDEDSRYLSKSECRSLQSVRVELKQMVEDAVVIYNGSEPLVNISWAEAIEPPEAATCFTQVRVFYGEERCEVVTRGTPGLAGAGLPGSSSFAQLYCPGVQVEEQGQEG